MRITLTKVSKMCLIVYFIYNFWFVNGVMESRILLHGMSLLATGCIACEFIQTRKFPLPRAPFLNTMFLYGVYAFITGIVIAQHTNYMISQLLTFFLILVVCYDCCYVSKSEGSMDWIGKAVVFSAILSAIQVILFPYFDPVEGRASLGPNENPNVLGVILAIGIFFIVYRKKNMQEHFVCKMFTVLLLLYAIGMTGSRKALASSVILIAIWIISYYRSFVGEKISVRSILSVLLLCVGIIVGIYYIQEKFVDSMIFNRLIQLFENRGSASRNNLYQEAFEVWKQHPIFGVGYAQFSFYSSTRHISHSTYMEILSCTGTLGFLIVFIPIIKVGQQIFKCNFGAKQKGMQDQRYENRMLLALFLVELFLGFGQEWFYYPINIVVLLYISWEFNHKNSDNQHAKITNQVT